MCAFRGGTRRDELASMDYEAPLRPCGCILTFAHYMIHYKYHFLTLHLSWWQSLNVLLIQVLQAKLVINVLFVITKSIFHWSMHLEFWWDFPWLDVCQLSSSCSCWQHGATRTTSALMDWSSMTRTTRRYRSVTTVSLWARTHAHTSLLLSCFIVEWVRFITDELINTELIWAK